MEEKNQEVIEQSNSLSNDQIIEKINSNPELINSVLDNFKNKGLVVQTKEESDNNIEQLRSKIQQDIEDKIYSKYSNEIKSRFDNDIFELYGINKNPDEATHEYLKRSKREYEGNIKDKSSPREQDSVFEAQAKKILSDKDNEIAKLEKKLLVKDIENSINNIYQKKKSGFIKKLPEFFDLKENKVLEFVYENTKLIDGVPVIHKNGQPERDENLDYLTVDKYLSKEFASVMASPSKNNNNPQGPGIKHSLNNNEKELELDVPIPQANEVTTAVDLTKYLIKNGIVFDDDRERYKKNYNGLMSVLKITQME